MVCPCRSERSSTAPHGTGPSQLAHAQRIGELDLAAAAGLHPLELGEDVGRQHVTPDDDQITGGVFDGRLFDHRTNLDHTVRIHLGRRIDHAIGADFLERHALQTDDAAPCGLAQPGHLVEQRRVAHQLVGKQHGERLVAHLAGCTGDGVAETERSVLVHERDLDVASDRFEPLGQPVPPGRPQLGEHLV